MQRIEEMDEENCSLQTDLSSLIEEKEQLENSLAGALKHKKTEVYLSLLFKIRISMCFLLRVVLLRLDYYKIKCQSYVHVTANSFVLYFTDY